MTMSPGGCGSQTYAVCRCQPPFPFQWVRVHMNVSIYRRSACKSNYRVNQARLSSVIAPAPTAGTANSESARGGMRLARQAREIRQWRSVCTMLCGDPTHPG